MDLTAETQVDIPGTFLRLHAETWEALVAVFEVFMQSRWVFRGQPDAKWRLESSLERALKRSGRAIAHWSYDEDYVIQEFRRRAHHYYSHTPAMEERFEWWALLRHHGAPARLLDVTYSPFIAAYFACETVTHDQRCAIWAINDAPLFEKVQEAHRGIPAEKTPIIDKIFFMPWDKPAVWHQTVYLLNERMAAQQGAFLVPSTITDSFERNLFGALGPGSYVEHSAISFRGAKGLPLMATGAPPAVVQVSVEGRLRADVLQRLRSMNISAATLYPGLDGYARSIGVLLETGRIL